MRTATALLLALLVAGCSGTPGGPSAGSAPAPFAFGPAHTPTDAPDGFGTEPSLLVARDGAIYFTSVLGSATARGDALWKSADNGTTWTYLGKADYPFGGGDSDIDELRDGTLLLTGQWRPAAFPANPAGSPYITGGESVFRSTDGGATWTPFPAAGYLPAADRNWLATAGDSQAWLVYNDDATGLMVGHSIDGGQTWLPPVAVPGTGQAAGTLGGPNGIAGDAVVDGNGTLYIPYGPSPGGGTVQRVYSSTDLGQTFTEHVARTTPPGGSAGAIFSTLAVDGAGTLYLAWAETEGKAMRALVAESHDQAATWSDPVAVSPPGLSIAFPWVAAAGPGTVAVGYLATPGQTTPDGAAEGASWVPMVSLLRPGRMEVAVQVTATPNHVGPICTNGTGCSSGRGLGDFFEIAFDPWGRVVVVWPDDTGDAPSNHVAVQAG